MTGECIAQQPPVLALQATTEVFVLTQQAWAGSAKTWSYFHLVHLYVNANSRY
jgi:hypothetical protein